MKRGPCDPAARRTTFSASAFADEAIHIQITMLRQKVTATSCVIYDFPLVVGEFLGTEGSSVSQHVLRDGIVLAQFLNPTSERLNDG